MTYKSDRLNMEHLYCNWYKDFQGIYYSFISHSLASTPYDAHTDRHFSSRIHDSCDRKERNTSRQEWEIIEKGVLKENAKRDEWTKFNVQKVRA